MRRRTRLPSSRPRGAVRHPGRGRQPPRREDHVNLEADQFGGELSKPIELPLPRPNLEEHVLAFDIPKLGEPLPKALVAAVEPMEGADVEHPYPRRPPRPLRVGRERRCQESQRDDCPEESDFHGSPHPPLSPHLYPLPSGEREPRR